MLPGKSNLLQKMYFWRNFYWCEQLKTAPQKEQTNRSISSENKKLVQYILFRNRDIISTRRRFFERFTRSTYSHLVRGQDRSRRWFDTFPAISLIFFHIFAHFSELLEKFSFIRSGRVWVMGRYVLWFIRPYNVSEKKLFQYFTNRWNPFVVFPLKTEFVGIF